MPRLLLLLAALLLLGCQESRTPGVLPQPPARTLSATAQVLPLRQTTGQSVYVPVYSHIFFLDETQTFNLTVTLSVRNTDSDRAMSLVSVRYYDTAGSLLHHYIDQPVRLGPLASVEYVVREIDTRGGAGANFLVDWTADQSVTEPVIEAVMIGTAGQQGISFISPGRVVGTHGTEAQTPIPVTVEQPRSGGTAPAQP